MKIRKTVKYILLTMMLFVLSSCQTQEKSSIITSSSNKSSSQAVVYSKEELIDNYILYLLENATYKTPIWNTEKYPPKKGSYVPYWNYIDGVFLNSINELYKINNDTKYKDFLVEYVSHNVDDNGNMAKFVTSADASDNKYELDSICESKLLFDLYDYTKDEKYKKAIEQTIGQLKNQPRTKEYNFWHKKRYPQQIWLDGFYMAMPFLSKYASLHKEEMITLIYKELNENELITKKIGDSLLITDDIYNQYKNVREIMFDEDKKLYYHGYDSSKSIFWANSETGLSESFWLRAMGWFFVSIVDVLEYYPKGEKYDYIAGLLNEGLEGIFKYQDSQTKMFYQVVDKIPTNDMYKDNYLETSGSSMIAYAALKGARLELIDSKYKKMGEEIFKGICDKYLKNKNNQFNLGGICKSAGLGPSSDLSRDGSYDYYVNGEPVVENEGKGIGPFIMAFLEIR